MDNDVYSTWYLTTVLKDYKYTFFRHEKAAKTKLVWLNQQGNKKENYFSFPFPKVKGSYSSI